MRNASVTLSSVGTSNLFKQAGTECKHVERTIEGFVSQNLRGSIEPKSQQRLYSLSYCKTVVY